MFTNHASPTQHLSQDASVKDQPTPPSGVPNTTPFYSSPLQFTNKPSPPAQHPFAMQPEAPQPPKQAHQLQSGSLPPHPSQVAPTAPTQTTQAAPTAPTQTTQANTAPLSVQEPPPQDNPKDPTRLRLEDSARSLEGMQVPGGGPPSAMLTKGEPTPSLLSLGGLSVGGLSTGGLPSPPGGSGVQQPSALSSYLAAAAAAGYDIPESVFRAARGGSLTESDVGTIRYVFGIVLKFIGWKKRAPFNPHSHPPYKTTGNKPTPCVPQQPPF